MRFDIAKEPSGVCEDLEAGNHLNRKDDSMPNKLDHAAEVVGDAVGAVEAATATAGKRVKQGLSEAAATIGSSRTAER